MRLKLVLSIETQTHADPHHRRASSLQEKFQSQIGMGETSRAEYVNLKIKDKEKITIDGVQLKALHTPGHTQDSYSYLMDDRVFTGDTLINSRHLMYGFSR